MKTNGKLGLRSMRSLAFALVFALTGIEAQTQTTTARPASAYSAAVAIEWFQLDLQLTQQTPGFSPPVAARALGYLGLTLYESVVPGIPNNISLAGQLNELSSLPWAQPDEPLHWPTVANASLATMTRMMFPTATAENKARIDLLERSLPLKVGADFDPVTLTPEITNRSESFGKLMAMAIMTWARTDGGHEAWGRCAATARTTCRRAVKASGRRRRRASRPRCCPGGARCGRLC